MSKDLKTGSRNLSGAQEDAAMRYAEAFDGMHCRRAKPLVAGQRAGGSARRPNDCAWQMRSIVYGDKEWTGRNSRGVLVFGDLLCRVDWT